MADIAITTMSDANAPAPKPEICRIVDALDSHANQLFDQCQRVRDRISMTCRQAEPTTADTDRNEAKTELGEKLRQVDDNLASAIDLLTDLCERCEL